MMGIPPDVADRLSYLKFTALRHTWNVRHKVGDDDDVKPPSADFVRARQAELAELGISGKTRH
jgi:hypothetical protein